MKHVLAVCLILWSAVGFAQQYELGPIPKPEPFTSVGNEQQQAPSPQANTQAPESAFANFHILLSPASAPGAEEPRWLAVAPDGQLYLLPVSEVKERRAHGYRAYTFGELREALNSVLNINASLNA